SPPIPPSQPFVPDPFHLIRVPAQSSKISRYAIVGIVAAHLQDQMGVPVTNRLVPVCPTPVRDRRQPPAVTFLCVYFPRRAVDFPRLSPNMAEAEKGKR